ncbi:MAG: hypothetical protein Q9221_008979 [Calogaya cf. arnoldii]
MASVSKTASRPSSTSSSNNAQTTSPETAPGSPFSGQNGDPPPWVGSAIDQYQASLQSFRQNPQNATSTPPTTLVTSTVSSSEITSPAAAAASPSSTATSSNERVKIGVSIAFGVTFLWLISAFLIWWFLRKRRARKNEKTSGGHGWPSSTSTSHPCACECHEVEGSPGGPGTKREELQDTHRAEMKGSLRHSRTELPA